MKRGRERCYSEKNKKEKAASVWICAEWEGRSRRISLFQLLAGKHTPTARLRPSGFHLLFFFVFPSLSFHYIFQCPGSAALSFLPLITFPLRTSDAPCDTFWSATQAEAAVDPHSSTRWKCVTHNVRKKKEKKLNSSYENSNKFGSRGVYTAYV